MQKNNLPGSKILTADIGGSHITVGICDVETRTILPQSIVRMDVFSKGSTNDILLSWGNAFSEVLEKNPGVPISGLSIATPGPFDYKNGISQIKGLNKYEAIYGMDIRQCFADLLNLEPHLIRFRNDAESTIAGEVLMGAGQGSQRVLGVTLGTGFGSAYSENNITENINLGANVFKGSIADDYLSTRWFLKRYMELTGVSLSGGVRELSELAPQSPIARMIFNEFAINMGDVLAAPVEQLRPQILIICGNIAKGSKYFLPYLIQRFDSLSIKLGELDENAPLIGAAELFEQDPRKISVFQN